MPTVAQTILEQLGGNRFIAMTGARNLLSTPSSLRFQLPRGAVNKANFVTIELDGTDNYTVTFIKYRNLNQTVLSEHEMVPAINLKQLFTDKTGLDTSL